MKRIYVCGDGHKHNKSETRLVKNKRVCLTHNSNIVSAIFICDCGTIEDGLNLGQVSHKKRCVKCSYIIKCKDSRQRWIKHGIKNQKKYVPRSNVKKWPTDPPIRLSDCKKYTECLGGIDWRKEIVKMNCRICSGYEKEYLDPADFIGTGKSMLPSMGGRKYSTGRR